MSSLIPPDTEISKSARKRLLKAERYASLKVERRARQKQNKRLRAEKRKANPDSLESPAAGQSNPKKRKVQGLRKVFKARVIIDLGFDDLMSEKEVISLCAQLAYTYSSHRHSCNPFESVLCTSLNGKTSSRLRLLGDQHKSWKHVEFLENGYETLWSTNNEDSDVPIVPKESVVYLTGDSNEELLELKEGETYIIGGICDHNRYKNLCLNKAIEQPIRHARLPIGKYLQNLPTRKILTVNQVFDILLEWVEHRDWEKALYAVMPKRKFSQTSKKKRGGDKQGENDVEDDGNVDLASQSDSEASAEGQPTLDNETTPDEANPS